MTAADFDRASKAPAEEQLSKDRGAGGGAQVAQLVTPHEHERDTNIAEDSPVNTYVSRRTSQKSTISNEYSLPPA